MEEILGTNELTKIFWTLHGWDAYPPRPGTIKRVISCKTNGFTEDWVTPKFVIVSEILQT